MTRALDSAVGLPSRLTSALWMLVFLMPADVSSNLMQPLLASLEPLRTGQTVSTARLSYSTDDGRLDARNCRWESGPRPVMRRRHPRIACRPSKSFFYLALLSSQSQTSPMPRQTCSERTERNGDSMERKEQDRRSLLPSCML